MLHSITLSKREVTEILLKVVYTTAILYNLLTEHIVPHLFWLALLFLDCLCECSSNTEEKLSPLLLRYCRKFLSVLFFVNF